MPDKVALKPASLPETGATVSFNTEETVVDGDVMVISKYVREDKVLRRDDLVEGLAIVGAKIAALQDEAARLSELIARFES